jgi:hypothetical protein
MVNKEDFETKLNLYKKAFFRKCLFCEAIIESANFLKKENQTLISTCEFCFSRYGTLQDWELRYNELQKNLTQENTNTLNEFTNCFSSNCFLCSVACSNTRKISGIRTCEDCFFRHSLLRKLEKQTQEIN